MSIELVLGMILAFAWGVVAGCWLRTKQIKSLPAFYGLRHNEKHEE